MKRCCLPAATLWTLSVSLRLRASKRVQYPSLRTLSTRRMRKTAVPLLCCGFRGCISWLCGEYVKLAAETKKNAPLTPAAMEVLTIIAYNQPVTKSFVEHIRGTDSSSVVNSLVEKGLLEEAGRLDVPGRPIAYRTTPVFLRCFGFESLDDLPPLPGHVPDEAEVSEDEPEI